MRRLLAVLAAAVALAACGSVSAVQATRNWIKESDYPAARQTLVGDVRSSEGALKAHDGPLALHTVCAVLYTDSESAYASLPSPDGQANHLLAKAYQDIGAGAMACYHAAGDATEERSALASLDAGLVQLSLGTIRLDVAAGRAP